MATNTYVALSTQTLGSAVSSVTFNSIPQSYTDLVVVINSSLASTTSTYMNFNGDTAGNYSLTRIYGNGSSAVSDRIGTNMTGIDVSYTGSGVGNNVIINVMNYSNSTTYKTSLNRWNTAGSTGYVGASVSLWRSTAAITSITFSNSVNFAVGSTFTIYGITAAAVGAKANGGVIYSDSQYIYHAFTSSGTFTPTQSISADILVIAGGGGGGYDQGGGGGAGGLLGFTSQALTATGYTVTVGSGGGSYANGTGSQFGALTATVGGGNGGIYNGGAGGAGGSGGGGGGGTSAGSGAAGTSGQGFAGGNGYAGNPNWGGGGGGGSAVAGTNASAGVPGSGGNGTSAYSSWLAVTGFGQNVSGTYYIAGGGAGGGTQATYNPTGYGGGGLGGTNQNGSWISGTAALANTGSGGGGAGATGGASGGAGGSGLVIVRYAR